MNPLDTESGRQVLAFLRLMVNPEDQLALRTLLQLRRNGLGAATISELYDMAVSAGTGFAKVVEEASQNPKSLSRFAGRLEEEFGEITSFLADLPPGNEDEAVEVQEIIETLVERVVTDNDEAEAIASHLCAILEELEAENISDFVSGLEASSEDIEQDLAENEVNILTMHKAKGLTAEAVIVAAAEDEYIPGRAVGEAIGDERRLLYVSLTRARHHLFVTYCNRRTGRQAHSGRTAGRTRRTLTQFLRNAPMSPVPYRSFLHDLAEHGTGGSVCKGDRT